MKVRPAGTVWYCSTVQWWVLEVGGWRRVVPVSVVEGSRSDWRGRHQWQWVAVGSGCYGFGSACGRGMDLECRL